MNNLEKLANQEKIRIQDDERGDTKVLEFIFMTQMGIQLKVTLSKNPISCEL